ncbi:MAG TPA: class I SAM-dependent methyltransferase [Jatrophihabitans sp.]|nr:class I SAM-dependent methyltransferase [Jatrophihabitans sp.]
MNAGYGRSFGQQADRYERYRPGYPAEAVDFALAAGHPGHILDLAAGTGKLTRALLHRAELVTAVEPDPEMRAVLADRLPGVQALAGSAERIPLPDASVDAVLVGQAFHWFDRPAADRELARVLTPGGLVGLLWNFPDRGVPWVPQIYQATREPTAPWAYQPADLADELFEPAERHELAWVYEVPGEDALLELARTWSWVIAQSPAEQARIDQRLRILRSRYPAMQGPVFRLPHRTRVLRHRLR